MVQKRYPDVNVTFTDGSLFWNRGMHRAFGEALKVGFDYYLWLNDDTYLYRESLRTLLDTHKELCRLGSPASIVVASTRDSRTGKFTYGGYRRIGGFLNPLRFRLMPPSETVSSCDTMCGNCVLIPREVADILGNIDPRYRHRWGDVDYGLRALDRNCEVWIAPGYLADCDANPNEDRWRDRELSITRRIEELHSLKGLGKQDWLRFSRIHGGLFWPLIWIRPYLRLAYDSFR
jgi:GT2 family glycosyltransferase